MKLDILNPGRNSSFWFLKVERRPTREAMYGTDPCDIQLFGLRLRMAPTRHR